MQCARDGQIRYIPFPGGHQPALLQGNAKDQPHVVDTYAHASALQIVQFTVLQGAGPNPVEDSNDRREDETSTG
mgnify:CR=1 FL=1